MKVYMRYRKATCRNGHKACHLMDEYELLDYCDGACGDAYFMEKIDPRDNREYYTCMYRDSSDCILCKDAKNIEIIIPRILDGMTDNYVKIGREYYSLEDIELLKIDYGEGWGQEWPKKHEVGA